MFASWAYMIVAALSAALSAYGTYSQTRQAAASAKYQEDVAEREAEYQKQKAEKEAADFKRRQRLLMSNQISNAAASGLTLESFSPVLEEDAAQAEYDYLTILHGGDVQAAKSRQDAKLFGMKARSTKRTGTIATGTSLLAGAGRTASAWPKSTPSTPSGFSKSEWNLLKSM